MAKSRAKIKQIWLPSVLGRLTILFFILSLLIFYFYVVGNGQGFADATLFFLMDLESWVLALGALAGMFSALAYGMSAPFRNRLYFDRILLSGLASAFCLLMYLGMALLGAFLESYP
ncbi:MAG: hypothetical protein MI717_09550 [Spirochaetales bacterium]|nr:hypothetical protein [Spirochaetales bacterium]